MRPPTELASELVRTHDARFEISPLRRAGPAGLVSVGFRVDAYARIGGAAGLPGSAPCQQVHAQLERVVSWAIARATDGASGAARVDVEPWAGALVEGPQAGHEEIRVRVHIDHASGPLIRPTDQDERRMLDRLIAALKELRLRN
jgi:hypothetical protein